MSAAEESPRCCHGNGPECPQCARIHIRDEDDVPEPEDEECPICAPRDQRCHEKATTEFRAIDPCGHVFCQTCCGKCTACPSCRERILKLVKSDRSAQLAEVYAAASKVAKKKIKAAAKAKRKPTQRQNRSGRIDAFFTAGGSPNKRSRALDENVSNR